MFGVPFNDIVDAGTQGLVIDYSSFAMSLLGVWVVGKHPIYFLFLVYTAGLFPRISSYEGRINCFLFPNPSLKIFEGRNVGLKIWKNFLVGRVLTFFQNSFKDMIKLVFILLVASIGFTFDLANEIQEARFLPVEQNTDNGIIVARDPLNKNIFDRVVQDSAVGVSCSGG